MYESLGFEALTPLAASVGLGLVLGGAYGALAQRSAFCLRRSLAGPWSECLPALGVWVMALATAIAGTRLAVVSGLVSFEAHRFLAPDLPVASALLGGALFGAGMMLTGGCASRLTVLVGAGNLRALLVLIVFAVTALATMRGGSWRRCARCWARRPCTAAAAAALTALPGGELWPLGLAIAAGALCAPLRRAALPPGDGGRNRPAGAARLGRNGVPAPRRLRPDSPAVP